MKSNNTKTQYFTTIDELKQAVGDGKFIECDLSNSFKNNYSKPILTDDSDDADIKNDKILSIKDDISKLNSIFTKLNELDGGSPNLSRYFNYKSFSFSHEQIRKEIERLNEAIDDLNGKEKTSFSMNTTVSLREGMIIKELYNDDSEKFVLVKSSVDNELYGVGSTKIIKMSEINHDDYICDDLDYFEKEKDYFEFENGRALNQDDEVEKKSKLVEMDENLWDELQEQIQDVPFANYDNDFVSIEVRKVSMSIENFERETNGCKLRFINYRDKIKDKYEELLK